MEKRILRIVDSGILLQHPYLFLFVLVFSFIVMDPFELSPVGGIDFRPVKNDIAPYKQVMESWPWDNQSRLGLGNLEFKDQIFGPESLEFDASGHGPYAGLADGRIVRWMGEHVGWETFALVSSNWYAIFASSISFSFFSKKQRKQRSEQKTPLSRSEELCAKGVDSTTYKQWKWESQCGRPLGLRFDKMSGNLYIADAYFGLMVVGSEGGLATPLATNADDGEPIRFANDLAIHENGSIFFTDTSKKYNRV